MPIDNATCLWLMLSRQLIYRVFRTRKITPKKSTMAFIFLTKYDTLVSVWKYLLFQHIDYKISHALGGRGSTECCKSQYSEPYLPCLCVPQKILQSSIIS